MMSNKQKDVTLVSGCSVDGVVGIVFIILKLVGVINWSWWWVTAPFWIPIALYLIVIVVIVIIAGIKDFIERRKRKVWR